MKEFRTTKFHFLKIHSNVGGSKFIRMGFYLADTIFPSQDLILVTTKNFSALAEVLQFPPDHPCSENPKGTPFGAEKIFVIKIGFKGVKSTVLMS